MRASRSWTNNFTGDLLVKYIDGTSWEVAESFTYRIGTPDGPEYVHIGKGMITDFASMPLVIRAIFRSPGGRWDKPAVVHDCLYKTGQVSRSDGTVRQITRLEADDVFLEAMGVTDTTQWKRRVIYGAVRVGGWVPWNRHRAADLR